MEGRRRLALGIALGFGLGWREVAARMREAPISLASERPFRERTAT
jgi:hypothetical protein